MAVSYLSRTPFRSSSYVLPLDLGLFSKVMETKQSQSDLNAQRIQSGIDQLGQLDVLRPQDRNYLNEKVKNLVSNINTYGGKDFTDPNVFNQIEGLGSDIYGDGNIINAISSTKSVRKLMTGYEQYKSNPKLTKLYSPVNEAVDMNEVNKWMNGDKVGELYQGPSSASPYVPYKETHLKQFNKLVADITTGTTVDGLYILKDKVTRITPDRIMSQAADLLTPDERGQMKKDAWYLYTQQLHLSPEGLVNKSLDQYQQRLSETKNMMHYYESQADASVSDPNARNSYNQLADQKARELSELGKNPDKVVKSMTEAYGKDPQEFMYQVYSNDYFRGLGNRFSVNQTDRTITPNYAEIARRRLSQAESQFDRKLTQDDTHFYDNLKSQFALKGMYMSIDPQTGEIKGIPIKGLYDTLNSSNVSTNAIKPTQQTLTAANNQLQIEIDKEYNKFLSDLVAHNPEIGIERLGQRSLIGQQFLEGVNQKPGLQIEDFKGLESNAVRGQIEKAYRDAGIKNISADMAVLDQFWRNYKAALDGKGNTIGEIPREFIDVVDKVSIIKERIRANAEILKQTKEAVYNESFLDEGEKATYEDYLKNPDTYPAIKGTSYGPGGAVSYNIENPKIAKIKSKLGNFDKKIDEKISGIATGGIFKTKTITEDDPSIKREAVSNFMLNELSKGRGQISVGDKVSDVNRGTINDLNITDKSINPTETGMYADGTGRFYISGQIKGGTEKAPKIFTYTVPIDDDNAVKMGLNRDPFEHLNYSVSTLGRSGDIPIYANKNMAITINVVKKNTLDINDNTAFAQAKVYSLDISGDKIPDGKGGFKYTSVTIPNTDGETPSVAYQKAYQAIWQSGNNSIKQLSTKDFIEYISKNQNR